MAASDERRANHVFATIKQYWPLLIVAGGLITLYFQISYVVQHVSPDKVASHLVRKQLLDQRWCLTKKMINKQSTITDVMECAD